MLISIINAFFLAFLVFTLDFCNIWHVNFLNLERDNLPKLNLQLQSENIIFHEINDYHSHKFPLMPNCKRKS